MQVRLLAVPTAPQGRWLGVGRSPRRALVGLVALLRAWYYVVPSLLLGS